VSSRDWSAGFTLSRQGPRLGSDSDLTQRSGVCHCAGPCSLKQQEKLGQTRPLDESNAPVCASSLALPWSLLEASWSVEARPESLQTQCRAPRQRFRLAIAIPRTTVTGLRRVASALYFALLSVAY
jgi:hypothetical protein